jgi:hypothetical protein
LQLASPGALQFHSKLINASAQTNLSISFTADYNLNANEKINYVVNNKSGQSIWIGKAKKETWSSENISLGPHHFDNDQLDITLAGVPPSLIIGDIGLSSKG